MTFNKKLLVLAITHFAFAQLVFAADKKDEFNSKTASRVANFTGSAVQFVDDNIFKVDSAADKGSAACQGCGQALIRVTRAGTDLTLALLTNLDGRTNGKLSAAMVRALALTQTADLAVTAKIDGTMVGNAYGRSKATIGSLYSILHEAIYPKLA